MFNVFVKKISSFSYISLSSYGMDGYLAPRFVKVNLICILLGFLCT